MASPDSASGKFNPRCDKAQAQALKEQGNARFEARAWKDAVKLYSKAIELDPEEASYYSNRAAAQLMMGLPKACIEDCYKAISIKPTFVKAHVRLAKALRDLGELDKAVEHLRKACDDNNLPELKPEVQQMMTLAEQFAQGRAAYEHGDFALALQFFASMLDSTEDISCLIFYC